MKKETFSLILFHGSGKILASKSASSFCNKIRKNQDKSIAYCFLQGTNPSLPEALAKIKSKGYKYIKIYPLFLLPGYHLDTNIPDIVQEFLTNNPEIKISIGKCLVDEPLFQDAIISLIYNKTKNA